MRTHKRKEKYNPQAQNIIQSKTRSFGISSQNKNLQALQKEAQESGFNFGDISIFATGRSQLKSPIQTKLTIGEPGDKYEQEADTVAAQVVSQINSPQQQTAQKEEDIQRQTLGVNSLMRFPIQRDGEGVVSGEANQDFEQKLNSSRSGGRPLDKSFREKVEPALGMNLSNIRVHTDANADKLSRSIQARAFTTGSDIFFKSGEYNLNTTEGQHLATHEIVHTGQQGAVKQVSKAEDDKIRRTVDIAPISSNASQQVVQRGWWDNIKKAASDGVRDAYHGAQNEVDRLQGRGARAHHDKDFARMSDFEKANLFNRDQQTTIDNVLYNGKTFGMFMQYAEFEHNEEHILFYRDYVKCKRQDPEMPPERLYALYIQDGRYQINLPSETSGPLHRLATNHQLTVGAFDDAVLGAQECLRDTWGRMCMRFPGIAELIMNTLYGQLSQQANAGRGRGGAVY